MFKQKIDFVITWVDGNDLTWKEERDNHLFGIYKFKKNEWQYRDWENLQYWFRGVEKFAPFVNKIHFVTMGHLPKWLNTKHPKLNIVKHTDYMPREYLPTFSSHPIELNLYRIKELSESFVLFNDDMFLTNYVEETDFFINGKPVDNFVEKPIFINEFPDMFSHILLNCIAVINKNFNKKECIEKYKSLEIKENNLIKNINLEFNESFFGFSNPHVAQSFNKSTFYEVWQKEWECLNETSKNKFRTIYDVNQYVFKLWQIAKGESFVTNKEIGKMFPIQEDKVEEIVNSIRNQTCKMICINEPRQIVDFEKNKKIIQEAFNSILPDKSEFEI